MMSDDSQIKQFTTSDVMTVSVPTNMALVNQPNSYPKHMHEYVATITTKKYKASELRNMPVVL